MRSIRKLSKTALRIATPPGSTLARSLLSPGSSRRSTWSTLRIAWRSFSRPSGVTPRSLQSESRRISATAFAWALSGFSSSRAKSPALLRLR